MVVELRHEKATSRANLPPLSWDYWLWGTGPFIKTALVSCDQGHVGTASPQIHSIADDGMLSPSWVCPHKGCTWHVFARLVGWGETTGGEQ